MEKVNSQERIVLEIKILSEHQAFGLNNNELAALVGTSGVNVCRDLAVLGEHGWLERSEADGRLRLSIAFGKMANTIMKGFKTAKLQLAADEARYASEMQ